MAKELPYFRFTCQEWDTGDISLENDSIKGFFMDVCAYYWSQNCTTLYPKLIRKFPRKTQKISKLLENGIIKQTGDYIHIDFLDEQLAELAEKSSKLSEAGKKGVEERERRKHATLKPPLSIKDKDKDKDNKSTTDEGKNKTYQTFFDEFWSVYPKRNGKKTGKQAAFKNFKKIGIPLLTKVIANAKNYGINNDYPKDPERFLKNDLWKEWDTPQSASPQPPQQNLYDQI